VPVTPLAIAIALVVGITLGLLGAGGSILTVPALMFALGVDPKVAIVMAFPIVGGAAFVGAVRQWFLKNIDLRVALAFGAANMVGAFAGAALARNLSGTFQLALLVVVMTAASITMLTSRPRREAVDGAVAQPHRVTAPLLLLGAAAGVLTGMVGIGGGFILVPVLVFFGKLSMREATGTSLTVIAMNTGAAYAGYSGVVDVPWMLVFAFGGVTAIGVLIGGSFSSRIPDQVLRRGFGGMLLVVIVLLSLKLKTLLGV
jgi:uncharacterized membrane protein YfcA